MIHADTDGWLNRCKCGAVAGFETDSPAPFRMVQVRARCTECCEQTDYFIDSFFAALSWNFMMRGVKTGCALNATDAAGYP